MKKFVMILAGLAMIGAVAVGLINKGDREDILAELKGLVISVKDVTEKLGAAEDKREDTLEKETQAKDDRNQAAAAVEGVKQELKIVERALEDVEAEIKKVEIEQKEIDLAVQRVFPDGNIKSAEELRMTLTMHKDTLTERQNKKAELIAQMEAANQAKQVQISKVREEEKYQNQRAQKLAVGGLVATVIAVNNEWGFVMVNAGQAHGVSPDASLLVKRGNSRIGRLRIVNLEATSTIADVVDDSIVPGINVQPGDKVIFETSN
jgi:myosin heavy subunit